MLACKTVDDHLVLAIHGARELHDLTVVSSTAASTVR